MRILVTGATGMIGSALIPKLQAGGHETVRLRRSGSASGNDISWNPEAGRIDGPALDGFDAVVNLAGESISGGRWTEARKHRIRESRVQGTRLLVSELAKQTRKPRVLVNSSAIGFYGNRGNQILTEDSPPGEGFLAEVCRSWEAEAEAAVSAGIRVVCLRTGIVLSTRGGALARMLPPFRLGLGGKVGSGKQYMSWITLDDLCSVLLHAMTTDSLKGPVNAVAPDAVTNLEFTKALGAALHRPTVFPLPAAAARLMFGEMADELLLFSLRVQPLRLQTTGFIFRDREVGPALKHVLTART